MTETHDLPEPITSSRVTIPPSERARALYAACREADVDAWNGTGDTLGAILDVMAGADWRAVKEMLNATREGTL